MFEWLFSLKKNLKMYYVYILKSEMDDSFYIGYTNSLDRRLREHNEGKSRYTSKKIPWKIVYSEIFEEKSDAIKREIFLKKQKSREFYLGLIDNFSKND
jgi:putative endonuclease